MLVSRRTDLWTSIGARCGTSHAGAGVANWTGNLDVKAAAITVFDNRVIADSACHVTMVGFHLGTVLAVQSTRRKHWKDMNLQQTKFVTGKQPQQPQGKLACVETRAQKKDAKRRKVMPRFHAPEQMKRRPKLPYSKLAEGQERHVRTNPRPHH